MNHVYPPEPTTEPPEDDFEEPSAEWMREMADEAALEREWLREEDLTP